jgi:hypothetical protein
LCPINDVLVTDSISNIPSGYHTAMLDQGYVIAFSNRSTHLPIVRLKLTEEQPCVNPSEYAASSSRSLYKLLNQGAYHSCYTKLADSYTDPRYRKIGTIRESRLFEDNGVSHVIMNLPEYPHGDSNNYHWNLYTNSYYPWNTQCDSGSGLGMEFMIQQIDKSSTIASTQFSAMIASIVLLVIVLILACITIVYKSEDYTYDTFKEQKLVYFIIALVEIVISSIIAYYFLSCTNTINEYNVSVQKLSTSRCSDDFSNRIFTGYAETLVSNRSRYIIYRFYQTRSIMLV